MTMKGANFLEKLLDNQPVEWKKLGEEEFFIIENRGRKAVKAENRIKGEIPYYGANNIQDYVEGYTHNGVYVLLAEDGTQSVDNYSVQWVEGKFWANNHVHVLRGTDKVNTRFLFHYLRIVNYRPFLSGGDRAKLTKGNLIEIEIPIPPLSVQSRIVEILDKFTSLEAELEAELELRKKQYAYYREQLLNFSYTPPSEFNVVYRKLGEVAQYSKGRIDASTLSAKNYVGVDNLLQDCQGKKLSEHVPTEGRCTAYSPKDILIGNIRPYLKKIWFADNAGGTNGDVLVIQTTDERVLPEYLYQVLSDDAFFTYDMQHAKGAKMPRGNKDKILDYKIPIPSLSEQERIVEILDKFDTLTNSISEGLPLEIQLRRQQYEYYREQLLDFRRF